jgi:5-hydroxyisourate hydrolase-like protein (transthyretin family)
MKTRLTLAGLTLLACLITSCGPKGAPRKETFPVTGEVVVDGQPAATVQVTLTDVKGIDTDMPTFSSAMTNDQGKFAVSTYDLGDGVPEGEYVVTFMWGELNLFSMQYGGPDKLKDKYSDPAKSQFKITVEKGKPADMGRIELSTN